MSDTTKINIKATVILDELALRWAIDNGRIVVIDTDQGAVFFVSGPVNVIRDVAVELGDDQ